jgi:transcriptional regulator with XRE-family HTH domain
MIDQHIGARLRARREFMRLESELVAHKLNIPPPALQAMERGEQRISAALLFELTELLNVPLRYFFDGAYDFTFEQARRAILGDEDD